MGLRARRSIRLPGYDYGSPGAYFVTICTAQRRHLFGEVVDEDVRLSPLGRIADACLRNVPMHSAGVKVVSHVVMPNHVHAILAFLDRGRRGVQLNAPTSLLAGTPSSQHAKMSPRRNTLGVVVRTYKGAVTMLARRAGFSESITATGRHPVSRRHRVSLVRQRSVGAGLAPPEEASLCPPGRARQAAPGLALRVAEL